MAPDPSASNAPQRPLWSAKPRWEVTRPKRELSHQTSLIALMVWSEGRGEQPVNAQGWIAAPINGKSLIRTVVLVHRDWSGKRASLNQSQTGLANTMSDAIFACPPSAGFLVGSITDSQIRTSLVG